MPVEHKKVVGAKKSSEANKEYLFVYKDGSTLSLLRTSKENRDNPSFLGVGAALKAGPPLSIEFDADNKPGVVPLLDLAYMQVTDYREEEPEILLFEFTENEQGEKIQNIRRLPKPEYVQTTTVPPIPTTTVSQITSVTNPVEKEKVTVGRV